MSIEEDSLTIRSKININIFPTANLSTETIGKMTSSLYTENTPSKKGRSITGNLKALFFIFAVIILLTIYITPIQSLSQLLQYLLIDFLIFGVLFIISGWLEYSLLQKIDEIPFSKIQGAAEGLNEIQGKLEPEEKPLTSPISKQECVLYQLDLQRLINTSDSAIPNYQWTTYNYEGKGVPTLLTDNTGYLTIKFSDAGLKRPSQSTRYYLLKNNQPLTDSSPEGKNLMKNLDLTNTTLTITTTKKENEGLKQYLGAEHQLSILESIIKTEEEVFAMGRIENTFQNFNGKPLKKMTRDPQTGILSIRTESKRALEKKDKLLSYLSLTTGAVLLIISLYYLF
jgi:hypothetical protein